MQDVVSVFLPSGIGLSGHSGTSGQAISSRKGRATVDITDIPRLVTDGRSFDLRIHRQE